MKRTHCPHCGIIIYLESNGYYRCPIHGDFKMDYVDGKLKKEKRCAECVAKNDT